MATAKQRRAAKRRLKQYLLQERRYYREIRALFIGWLNDWLPRIGQAVGLKLDAASDWLGPLFAEMAADFAQRVERFKISIKKKGKDIADLSRLEYTDDTAINMAVMPWLTEPNILDEIDDFAAENAALITNIGNITTQRIQAATIDAIKTGKSSKKLKQAILKIDKDLGQNRARLIARDQIGKLQGQISRTRSEAAGITEYEWMTAGDERVRSGHKALDGTVRKWSESPTPGSEIQCLPEGSQVNFNSPINRLYRRFYSGELTRIITPKFSDVVCTPNHPILTDRGWVPAQFVNVGDNLLKIHSQGFGPVSPEMQGKQVNSRVDHLFEFASGIFGGFENTRGVGGQFHGDGSVNHQVDIINIKDLLLNDIKPAFAQEICKRILTDAFVSLPLAPCSDEFVFMTSALLGSSGSFVSSFSALFALLGGHLGHANDVRLALIAEFNAIALKVIGDCISDNPKALTDAKNAFTLPVRLDHGLNINLLSIGRMAMMPNWVMPQFAHGDSKPVGVTADKLGDLAKVHSSDVFADSVVNKIVSENFSGHVYNFETSNNYYCGVDAVYHNCRCTSIPIIE